jgi:hypothetical protein
MEGGRNGGEEETVAGEGKEVARRPKKGRRWLATENGRGRTESG